MCTVAISCIITNIAAVPSCNETEYSCHRNATWCLIKNLQQDYNESLKYTPMNKQ